MYDNENIWIQWYLALNRNEKILSLSNKILFDRHFKETIYLF